VIKWLLLTLCRASHGFRESSTTFRILCVEVKDWDIMVLVESRMNAIGLEGGCLEAVSSSRSSLQHLIEPIFPYRLSIRHHGEVCKGGLDGGTYE
jgi:hypothetical protein